MNQQNSNTNAISFTPNRNLNLLTQPHYHRAKRVSQLSQVQPGETRLLCNIEGPGQITHIWMTLAGHRENLSETYPRDLILRMYWDDETDPSVECPLFDFFGIGFGLTRYPEYFEISGLSVQPNGDHTNAPGLNCYFVMPFASRAKITLTNEGDKKVVLYRQIDWQELKVTSSPLRFHAKFRRENPAPARKRNFTLVEAIGRGHYIGCFQFIQIADKQDAWYHGGGDMIYVDGHSEKPSILHGIGGEDFIGHAWGTERFVGEMSGCLYQEGRATFRGSRYAIYRFYLDNPVVFENSIRVSQQVYGNDYSSVGFWYQEESHAKWSVLPPRTMRLPGFTKGNFEKYVKPLKPELQIPWFITNYYPGLENFKKVLPPEKNDKSVEWLPVRSHLGFLDFLEYFRRCISEKATQEMWGVVKGVTFAYTDIVSEVEQKLNFLIGFDDDLKGWINNKLAITSQNHPEFKVKAFKVSLKKGVNRLLLKSSNDGVGKENTGGEYMAHCITLKILDLQGKEAKNIKFKMK